MRKQNEAGTYVFNVFAHVFEIDTFKVSFDVRVGAIIMKDVYLNDKVFWKSDKNNNSLAELIKSK